MARRLGVMYIIYNNRMWGAWDGQWQEYNNCQHLPSRGNDNACHRTHMHLSLTWDGATGHTSFWTEKLAAVDFGPCRPADLNWAWSWGYVNPTPCRGLRGGARREGRVGGEEGPRDVVRRPGAERVERPGRDSAAEGSARHRDGVVRQRHR